MKDQDKTIINVRYTVIIKNRAARMGKCKELMKTRRTLQMMTGNVALRKTRCAAQMKIIALFSLFLISSSFKGCKANQQIVELRNETDSERTVEQNSTDSVTGMYRDEMNESSVTASYYDINLTTVSSAFVTSSEASTHNETTSEYIVSNETYGTTSFEDTDNTTGSIFNTTEEDINILPDDVPDEERFQPSMYFDDPCTCDLMIEFCDIGCCCDPDCTEDDLQVFTNCPHLPQTLTADSSYCYQKWAGIRLNTKYGIFEENRSGLFCIRTDNYPQRTVYEKLKLAKTPEQFEKLKQKTEPKPSVEVEKNQSNSLHEGDIIWGVDSQGRLIKPGLPSSLLTHACESTKELLFLNEDESRCAQTFDICNPSSALHPSRYVNFHLLSLPPRLIPTLDQVEQTTAVIEEVTSPSSVTTVKHVSPTPQPTTIASTSSSLPNSTLEYSNVDDEIFNDTFNANDSLKLLEYKSAPNFQQLFEKYNATKSYSLIKLEIFLCNFENASDCKSVDYANLSGTFDWDSIVKEVKYEIVHNGTNGIAAARATLFILKFNISEYTDKNEYDGSLINICHKQYDSYWPEDRIGFVEQKFSVIYRWIKTDRSFDKIYERSGRPGYVRGKPLLAGTLIQSVADDGKTRETILLDHDQQNGITILRSQNQGKCGSRTVVTFGENLRSSCKLSIKLDSSSVLKDDNDKCDLLREQILVQLLGTALSKADEMPLKIATYGDSSINSPTDWVPLLISKESLPDDYVSEFDLVKENSCSNLVYSISLEFLFAQQGFFANPQAKIIGSLLTLGSPQRGPSKQFECTEGVTALDTDNADIVVAPEFENSLPDTESQSIRRNCSVEVEVTTTVHFVDVTPQVRPVFPAPPSLDLKLPYDFFYPHLPSSAPKSSLNILAVLWLEILVLTKVHAINFV